jgi:hypothetical protein
MPGRKKSTSITCGSVRITCSSKARKPKAKSPKKARKSPKKSPKVKKPKAKSPKKVKKSKSVNPWMKHLSSFRKSHPKLSGKQVMTQAKKTYKSKSPSRKVKKVKKSKTFKPFQSIKSSSRFPAPERIRVEKVSRCEALATKPSCEMDGLFDDDHLRKCRWNMTKFACEMLPKELRERATYMQAKDETRYVAPSRKRITTKLF